MRSAIDATSHRNPHLADNVDYFKIVEAWWNPQCPQVVQQSNALHLSARGITTVPGSNPGCITSSRDWESHRDRTIGLALSGFGRPSL
jgi:hypothetical protein